VVSLLPSVQFSERERAGGALKGGAKGASKRASKGAPKGASNRFPKGTPATSKDPTLESPNAPAKEH